VFVEDCGRDNSWQVLQTLAEKDERVCAIQLLRNYGQASATMCGLRHSRGRFVITMDDDLQHPPEEIPVLIGALEKDSNLDAVIGIPREKKHALWRRLGSEILNIINSYVFKKDRSLKFAGFRIMRRLVVDSLVQRNVPQPAIGALLCSITPRIANVHVRHKPRAVGRSGYTLSKIFALTLSNFLAFSDFPLRFLAGIGVVGIVGSFLFGTTLLIRYLRGGIGVPGWITLVLLSVGISGFQFFAFGLVGEYLLRVLQSVHHTPQYVVRQQVGAWTQGSDEETVFRLFVDQPVAQSEIYARKSES
jgi:dolichol-phosphate mannosyltransferase/undecaprenyl-phosphate 4-deoxy-4-formamido-L-arabinose transferase